MGWSGRKSASIADIGFKSAVHPQPTPIAVVGGEQRGSLVIVVRCNCLGHKRASAVGADDDLRALDAASRPASSGPLCRPHVPPRQNLLDGEAFADLGAALSRGVDQQLVEYGPPWAVRDRCLSCAWRASDRERTKVEGVGVDRRAPGRHQPIEQAPLDRALTPSGCNRWVDTVSLGKVARSTTRTR